MFVGKYLDNIEKYKEESGSDCKFVYLEIRIFVSSVISFFRIGALRVRGDFRA